MRLTVLKEKFDEVLLKVNRLLVKLYMYCLESISKEAQRTLKEVIKALYYLIYSQNNFGLPKANAANDELAHQILSAMTNDNQIKHILSANQAELSETEKNIFTLLQNVKIRRFISYLYLSNAIKLKSIIDTVKRSEWIYSNSAELQQEISNSERIFQQDIDKANSYCNQGLPIEYSSLNIIRQEAKSESHELREELADKNALKINLDIQVISTLFALASGVFLFGGYIYNKIFLYHFGVNAAPFFSISDYLTSSLDTIVWAIISVGVSMSIIFFRLNARSRMPTTVKRVTQDKLNESIWKWLICVVIGALVFLGFLKLNTSISNLVYYPILYILIYVLAILLADNFLPPICVRFFHNPLPAYFAFTFILLFVSSVSFSALNRAQQYEDNKANMFGGRKILIKSDEINDLSQGRVILANSSYYFMLSNDNKKIIIYPTKNIQYLVIEQQ